MASILLITVNYRTPHEIVEFCGAARKLAPPDLVRIAVADNSASFAEPKNHELGERLAATEVSVCDTRGNLGYFGGARHVYDQLVDPADHPEWVIVSNSDLVFLDTDFFGRLAALEPEAGVMGLGPDILRMPRDRADQRSAFRENPMRISRNSATEMALRIRVLRSRLLTALLYVQAEVRRTLPRLPAERLPTRTPVYMIHGSFIILHRSYFERTAGLNFPAFLFGEELFVAEEVRKAGGTLLYEPSLCLAHVGGATTKIIPSNERRLIELASFEALYEAYFSTESGR